MRVLYNPKDKTIIDKGVVSIFLGPKSFTGEDVVEFAVHGGSFVAKKLIEVLLECGCRVANPGEFSYRAFLNEKLDMVQAEAIDALVRSSSVLESNLMINNIMGTLSDYILKTKESLLNLITTLEHELDFNDLELTPTTKNAYLKQAVALVANVKEKINSSLLLNQKTKNISVCFAGKTNVGKSSLFNLLLGYDRALVSRKQGTTRDIIEKNVIISAKNVTLVDTAGDRAAKDSVEKAGIKKAVIEIKRANILIFVDVKDPVGVFKKSKIINNNVIFVQNKTDKFYNKKLKNVFFTSCKEKTGIKKLLTKLSTMVASYDASLCSKNNLMLNA